MATVWALRCASADRIDFFPANIVRTREGDVEIRGGNIRTYKPEEVWFVRKGKQHLDEVRGLVRETEEAMRGLARRDDVQFAYARDAVSVHMTQRAMDVLKRACVHGTKYEIGV